MSGELAAPERHAPAGEGLVVADIALFYGAHTGGIRTYLHQKAAYAEATGAFEHHVIVPAERERHDDGRHELPSVELVPTAGMRIPFRRRPLVKTLRAIEPDLVVIHDPFWRPARVAAEAHRLGGRVVAAHHASAALNAAGIPGPDSLYLPFLRRAYKHAYGQVDAVMSVVDPRPCSGREATLPLRFGLDPAFRPGPAIRRDHVLYAGRLAWEKGVFDLLEAAALAQEPWPLRLVGNGPAAGAIETKAERLGIADRIEFTDFVSDQHRLARLYREASCVVQPGPHETFGLVSFEAAASGTRAVTCSSTPSSWVAAPLIETFEAGDPAGLLDAIERARAAGPDLEASRALADRYTWEGVFEAELADMTSLLGSGDPVDR